VGGNEKERESVENILFSLFFFLIPFHVTNCLFIFTNCNINAILALIVMNNIKKKLVMIASHFGNQIIANQNTISNKIGSIYSDH